MKQYQELNYAEIATYQTGLKIIGVYFMKKCFKQLRQPSIQ